MPAPRRRRVLLPLCALLLLAAACAWKFMPGAGSRAASGSQDDYRTAAVARGPFRQTMRRVGVLRPVKEQHLYVQVAGVIQEMAAQGKVVKKNDVVLKMDPVPHEDARAAQEGAIVEEKAEYKQTQQAAAKILNSATEDVGSYELRVELENMRLAELEKGPTATEQVNAEVTLENHKNLLAAREDELKTLQVLAAEGYASKEEVRQKQSQTTEERLQVQDAELKLRKLQRIDPVALKEQKLKVRDAEKTRDAAAERVKLLERNMQRDADRYNRRMERENLRLATLVENLKRTVHLAPGPGVVVHKRHRWYTFAPGREVYEGQEVIALPDFTKMKAVLTVDEGRIANVSLGQEAEIAPAGWSDPPIKGRVVKVAGKGRDEFEAFQEETTSIYGTANRQVFEVEVVLEMEGERADLRPGLRADVEIAVNTIPDAAVVPRTALVKENDGATIVRVFAKGSSERREVKVLAENELFAAVDGVREGERVWLIDPGR